MVSYFGIDLFVLYWLTHCNIVVEFVQFRGVTIEPPVEKKKANKWQMKKQSWSRAMIWIMKNFIWQRMKTRSNSTQQRSDYWYNSYLLAFLYVVILSDIRTSDKHDIQLGKMPKRERMFSHIKTQDTVCSQSQVLFFCSLHKLSWEFWELTLACCTQEGEKHPGLL